MVLKKDADRRRFTLSTKALEPERGDMLRDKPKVFDSAAPKARAFEERAAAAALSRVVTTD